MTRMKMMVTLSVLAILAGSALPAADPQRGGRGDGGGRDGGGGRGDGGGDRRGGGPGINIGPGGGGGGVNVGPGAGARGGVNVPGVNVQPPRVQTPNVQPRVNVNPGNPAPSVRQSVPHGAARVSPGAGIQVGPGAGAGIGGRTGANLGVGGRDGVRAGARGDFNARGDLNDRFLGGNSINLGSRSLNIAGNNYRPSHQRHRWYGGYWNFNNWGRGGWGQGWGYGGWGYGGWGGRGGYWGRPFGWGLGAWGLGSLIYNSGYLGYWNPYYYGGGAYDYAQPIPVAYYGVDNYGNDPAEEMLNSAIAAFRRTEYDAALNIVDRAISQHPDDAVLHEFRALVLFAKGDFRNAAGTIHSVLAIGPGMDWSTMSRLYSDVAVYTSQLRALEFYTKEHPDDAAGLFLLSYHYLSTGHPDAAARKLQNVVQLQPNDRVAADLLKMISSGSSSQPAAGGTQQQPPQQPVPQSAPLPPSTAKTTPQPPAEAPRTSGPPVNAAMLAGNWHAERDDGSKFELILNQNSTFTWRFSNKEAKQEFSGTFTVEGNTLALQRQDGGSLVGNVTPSGDGRFNFKLLGGPPEDKGLDFAR